MFLCCCVKDESSKEVDRVAVAPVMSSSYHGESQGATRAEEKPQQLSACTKSGLAKVEPDEQALKLEAPSDAAEADRGALSEKQKSVLIQLPGQGHGEFSIKLTKDASSGKIGVDVCRVGSMLKINCITEGLICDWNVLNPGLAVRVLDCIVAVNGKRGNADELLQVIATEMTLDITLERP